jgi:fermentation-respiration switch protein FrsA (DUF1100 family)
MNLRTIGIIAALLLGALAAVYAAGHFYGRSVLYHPTRAVVAPTTAGVSAERIATEDGETLVAWWLPPQQGQPVFLFFDGNGGRPEIHDTADGRWARMAAHGAGFLAVYYRGYSGSTGSPTEQGLRRDARAGYDWLIARGYAPDDIVIHGFSLGSAVAVQLAAERPARALILEAPMTGIDDIAAEHGAGLFAPMMRDSFRSRDYVGRVRMPVLIAHGDADSVIPLAHGQRLYALANEPKQFVLFPGSDHATLPRDGLYEHIWTFLEQQGT